MILSIVIQWVGGIFLHNQFGGKLFLRERERERERERVASYNVPQEVSAINGKFTLKSFDR